MGAEPTRAEIARRRLEQLNASFRTVADPPEPADQTAAETGGQHVADAPAHRPRLSPVHLRLVAVIGIAAGVLLVWWVLAERPEVEDLQESTELSAPVEQDEAEAPGEGADGAEVVVDVAGKVEEPGIVVLPEGARVHEAIEAAGGTKGRVDTTSLNLARVLADGEQVLVGVEAAGPPAGAGEAGAGPSGAAVNLNTATAEELQSLPGVGPVTAESIVAWRTENGRFASVDDLLEVSGIGEKTLADLRDRVTV